MDSLANHIITFKKAEKNKGAAITPNDIAPIKTLNY